MFSSSLSEKLTEKAEVSADGSMLKLFAKASAIEVVKLTTPEATFSLTWASTSWFARVSSSADISALFRLMATTSFARRG